MGSVNEVLTLRQSSGLTQGELAARSGVAQPNIAAYESGRRRPSKQMLTRLRDATRPRPSEAAATNRETILRVLAAHRISNPRVFGSASRAADAPGSDLDLLVDTADDADILEIIDCAETLESVLGVPVDIVTARSLDPSHEIMRTAIPL